MTTKEIVADVIAEYLRETDTTDIDLDADYHGRILSAVLEPFIVQETEMIDYTHFGRCFECSELTGLNKNTLMCEAHDYEKKIIDLEARLAEARKVDATYAAMAEVVNPKIELLEQKLAEANELYDQFCTDTRNAIDGLNAKLAEARNEATAANIKWQAAETMMKEKEHKLAEAEKQRESNADVAIELSKKLKVAVEALANVRERLSLTYYSFEPIIQQIDEALKKIKGE